MSIDIKDPVRGMNVDPKSAVHRAEQRDAEPLKSVKPEPAKSTPIEAGAIYTCPMHPQIRQVGPGNCPICGMTLEPVKATVARELVAGTLIRPFDLSLPGYRFYLVRTSDHQREKTIQAFATWLQSVV